MDDAFARTHRALFEGMTAMALGDTTETEFPSMTLALSPGARLVLSTAGVTEAEDAKDSEYGDARLASNESGALEGENHLVNRWWADAEMALHVGFGRSAPEHVRVRVDEGQILALLFGEAWVAARGA